MVKYLHTQLEARPTDKTPSVESSIEIPLNTGIAAALRPLGSVLTDR